MRISDWSSDVCSSDLHRTDHARSAGHGVEELHHGTAQRQGSLPQAFLFADARYHSRGAARTCAQGGVEPGMTILSPFASSEVEMPIGSALPHRSKERRVGKQGVSKFRSRWSP